MQPLHTYRVWFKDGSAVLVNAYNEDEAWNEAIDLFPNGNAPPLKKIEKLS